MGRSDQEGGTKMQCKHPMIRIESQTQFYRNKKGVLSKKAKVISSKEYEKFAAKNDDWIKVQEIPCGKCIGCRLDYSKTWATRAMLEAMQWEENYFITLTYDDKHKPYNWQMPDLETGQIYTDPGNWNGYLNPDDMKHFMYRLRTDYARKFKHRGIRMMYCGEYGEDTKRPHYHAILFNMPIPANELKVYKQTYTKDFLYTWDWLTEEWGKGNVIIAEVTWNTCAYVARYMCKKQKGPTSSEYYASRGQTPEFMRVSNRPGLARQYYEEHKKEIYAGDELIIKGRNGKPVCIKPPKYFDNLFKEFNKEYMEELKERRSEACQTSEKLKGKTTTLKKAERLEIEERSIKARTTSLKRNQLDLDSKAKAKK